MPVQLFIGRAPEGDPIPPDYSHEMLSTIEIIKGLWGSFHHHQPYYAIVTNLHEPSVDMLVISERGIGVIELKHYYGRISCRNNGAWYAGPKRMVAGVEGRGFKNPHEQVQTYAEQIRQRLLNPPLWQDPWLPGKPIDWPNFKFHTAVCFTHPNADLSSFEENLRRKCRPVTLPWEDFSVLNVIDVPSWAISLRFEVGTDRAHGFTRHRLSPSQINRILTKLFDLTRWKEAEELMPSGQPFGFLNLIENDRSIQVVAIDKEEIVIGRDLNTCDIPIPDRFFLVSRIHARIFRTPEGVFVEDLDSTNGSYIDGRRVYRRTQIQNGQQLTLGRSHPGQGVANFEFSLQPDNISTLDVTTRLEVPRRFQSKNK